ncbi:hypothetical protein ACFQ3Z_45730 [Streptomyces nogalater]
METTQTRRISLVCPDCGTWVALTSSRGTYLLKLVPHHTGKAGVADAIRCRSSNRLVDVDITDYAWRRQYREWAREERLAVDLTRHRRATVQTLKVRPQERPADRRAQWERAMPAARRADAARAVPADAVSPIRGAAVDGPVGAPLTMTPRPLGTPLRPRPGHRHPSRPGRRQPGPLRERRPRGAFHPRRLHAPGHGLAPPLDPGRPARAHRPGGCGQGRTARPGPGRDRRRVHRPMQQVRTRGLTRTTAYGPGPGSRSARGRGRGLLLPYSLTRCNLEVLMPATPTLTSHRPTTRCSTPRRSRSWTSSMSRSPPTSTSTSTSPSVRRWRCTSPRAPPGDAPVRGCGSDRSA